MSRPKPVILLILDGFGLAPPARGNAVAEANMPVFHRLITAYPAMTLQASGPAVGLSWGEMGNSEVGHITIGAGRIMYQSLPRIDLSIQSGEFFTNSALKKACAHAQEHRSALHLIGLVSVGGVHASQEHLYAMLELARREGLKNVFVHVILDGRDAQQNGGTGFVQELLAKMQELGVGKIASISGRFYAMDRDNRWDRIELAYKAMALGQGPAAEDPITAIEASYAQQVFDEQFVPTVMVEHGKPIAPIQDGDACVFFNFRPDRARQLTKAFVIPAFAKFERKKINDLFFVTMTEYEKDLPVEVAFPPQLIDHSLAEVISEAGMKQLHIAETEKYAHVTFFLNGKQEQEFAGEDRVIIPSPRVSSYDKQPEMSAPQITEHIVKETLAGTYDFIVANFANADMVGHTGDEQATIKALETVDQCIGKIVDTALGVGGAVLITADHGNAEEVVNLTTGEMDKEHSTNPVPFLIVSKSLEGMKAPQGDVIGGDLAMMPPVGMLADVAPTVLKLLELNPPAEWTGQSLI